MHIEELHVKNTLSIQMAIFEMTIIIVGIGSLSFMENYQPLVMFISCLYPAFFGVYTFRHGYYLGGLSVVLSAIVVMLIPGVAWLNILTVAGPVGLMLGFAFKKRLKLGEIFLLALATAAVGAAIWYSVMSTYIIQADILTLIKDNMMALKFPPELLEAFSNLEMDDFYSAEVFIKQTALLSLPSMTVSVILAIVFLNFRLAHLLLVKLKHNVIAYVPFREIKLPKDIIMGTTIILVLTFLTNYFFDAIGMVLLDNVILIVMLVFSFQGLTVIAFFLHKNRIKGVLGVIAFTILAVILHVFGLSIIGWIDSVFDTRKLRAKV